jgi:hypothetical protein
MVLGYALLTAISALRSRVALFWLTTALCVAGYAMLVVSEGAGSTSGTTYDDPNVVVVLLIATGYVSAVQVDRAGAALNVMGNQRR